LFSKDSWVDPEDGWVNVREKELALNYSEQNGKAKTIIK
jgi:hypothetical protein